MFTLPIDSPSNVINFPQSTPPNNVINFPKPTLPNNVINFPKPTPPNNVINFPKPTLPPGNEPSISTVKPSDAAQFPHDIQVPRPAKFPKSPLVPFFQGIVKILALFKLFPEPPTKPKPPEITEDPKFNPAFSNDNSEKINNLKLTTYSERTVLGTIISVRKLADENNGYIKFSNYEIKTQLISGVINTTVVQSDFVSASAKAPKLLYFVPLGVTEAPPEAPPETPPGVHPEAPPLPDDPYIPDTPPPLPTPSPPPGKDDGNNIVPYKRPNKPPEKEPPPPPPEPEAPPPPREPKVIPPPPKPEPPP
ncbi:MAG: hypothetical protein KME31_11500 [Tolypothrix carrinoi HA7290-LM1]|jgi:hypothetical protein|nr:hypothetical protein [Tolypothrix carrinoi HA7290-LM1]